jgi:hypothetical protein
MRHRLFTFNPLVWRIVETGFSNYADEANPTDLEQRNSHYNAQAMNALYCGLSDDQLYRVWHLESAKEVWDALRIMHTQDSSVVHELKAELLREEMRSFALHKGESPNDMYLRLHALVRKMEHLGCKEVTDSYVVRKMLRAMAPRNPSLVSNICEDPKFEELTPQDVRDTFVIYEIQREYAKVDTGRETSYTAPPPRSSYGELDYPGGSSGETPRYAGAQYLSWQRRMKFHLLSIDPLVWASVETGFSYVDEANLTALEKRYKQCNDQAWCALYRSLDNGQASHVYMKRSAKEIWDDLRGMAEAVREPKLDGLRAEMDWFTLGEHETPQDMYTRLNKFVNDMKGLGCKEMTDSYVVRKMLRVMTPSNSTLVTLIRGKPNFEQLTPRDVLATFLLYDMVQKDSKIVSHYASPSSNKKIKISLKAQRLLAEESSDEEHDQDQDREHIQEMTLLVKNFGRMLGKKEHEARGRSNFPDKSQKRNSRRSCYKCGAPNHLVANCPFNSYDD